MLWQVGLDGSVPLGVSSLHAQLPIRSFLALSSVQRLHMVRGSEFQGLVFTLNFILLGLKSLEQFAY